MMAFFPDVSASSGRPGRQVRNSSAVSADPVRSTCSTRVSVIRSRPSGPSSRTASCRSPRGTPASHSDSARTAATRRADGAGFSTTADPTANAAATPPNGIAIGKFQGDATTVTRGGS